MKLLIGGVVAVVLAIAGTSVRADETAVPLQHGSYFTAEGGLNILSGGDAMDVYRTPENLKFKFRDGPAVSISGGYKWESGLRSEVEVSYRSNNVKDFDTNQFPLSGHQTDVSLMANLLYDINTGTRFTPYVGAGIGAAMVWWKKFANAGSPEILNSGASSTRFAIQAIAGAAYALGAQWEALIDLRYKGSNGHAFPGIQTVDSITGYKLRETTVMVGLRYAFDAQTRPSTWK